MIKNIMIILTLSMAVASCSTKIISNNYYQQHKTTLDNIENRYEKLNATKAFAVSFTDKDLSRISIEMISDTLTRIYDFWINEQRLTDSLYKFNYDTAGILFLIKRMQQTKVTWINSVDYYVNDLPQQLIYLSIKPVTRRYLFSPPRYLAFGYFRTPQSFDEKGRLLDNRRTKRIRKIKGQVFYKISDRICYTITDKYR
jgi:hypothetical protein